MKYRVQAFNLRGLILPNAGSRQVLTAMSFFEMGGYAAYVWPAFGAGAVVLIALLAISLHGLKSREKALSQLSDPKFQKVLWRSIFIAIVLLLFPLLGITGFLNWILPDTTVKGGTGWELNLEDSLTDLYLFMSRTARSGFPGLTTPGSR